MRKDKPWENSDDEEPGSGFEDIPGWEKGGDCMHRGHEPPNMLYVPPGKRYRHVCPGCGKVTYINGSSIRWCAR